MGGYLVVYNVVFIKVAMMLEGEGGAEGRPLHAVTGGGQIKSGFLEPSPCLEWSCCLDHHFLLIFTVVIFNVEVHVENETRTKKLARTRTCCRSFESKTDERAHVILAVATSAALPAVVFFWIAVRMRSCRWIDDNEILLYHRPAHAGYSEITYGSTDIDV